MEFCKAADEIIGTGDILSVIINKSHPIFMFKLIKNYVVNYKKNDST